MVSTLTSLSALLLGFALLCLGHGLNNTLLGLRAVQEHYPDWALAMMSSAYFAGFILGARTCMFALSRVGHIRSFAAFASMASAVSLAYLLLLSEAGWIVLRLLYGFCIAALYVALESWLNALSERNTRGRIMSLYMTINFLALAAGQWLLLLGSPDGHELFLLVSILISLALVPTSISRRQPPQLGTTSHLRLGLLRDMNPAAVIGVFGLGLSLGAYWGLGPAFLSKSGMSGGDVARFISAGFVGGLVCQWPLGWLSDHMDRRLTIAGTLALGVLVSLLTAWMLHQPDTGAGPVLFVLAFLFGGTGYTLYSLFVALANDFLAASELVAASALLIMLQAAGALFGPVVVTPLTSLLGPAALFLFFGLVYTVMLAAAVYDYRKHRAVPRETATTFAAVPRLGPVAATLDDRAPS